MSMHTYVLSTEQKTKILHEQRHSASPPAEYNRMELLHRPLVDTPSVKEIGGTSTVWAYAPVSSNVELNLQF